MVLYQILNIYNITQTPKMNKQQPSNPHFKSKSRQKQKLKLNPSKSKLQVQTNRSTHFDNNISNPSKSKQKQPKIVKKVKIDMGRSETATTKQKIENKQQSDQYGLYMKADLKNLISKNNVAKQKNHDIVPQLLKNIEKNCKALKNIHHKQSQILQKKSGCHSNKLHKSKRISIQYKKSDQNAKMRQSQQKDRIDKQELPVKKNRFSLQISQGEIEKTKIEQKLKQNVCRKSAENKVEQKNFVELFKLYKKSFEIEDFKIQKSNRKTNYNTNQSRNSSSHHNSHGHSRAGDYNFQRKSREQDKVNIQKIQNLIKSQQKKAEGDTVQADSLVYNPISCIKKQQTSDFLLSYSRNTDKELCQSIKVDKVQDNFMNHPFQRDINRQIESKVDKDVQKEGIMLKIEERQNKESLSKAKYLQQFTQKVAEQNLDKEVLQKKFQKSKFYVQPLPRFEQIKKQDQELPEDMSLIGCQITLIENNIILEDSALGLLQL